MNTSSLVRDDWRGEPACRPGSVPSLSRGGGHPSRAAVADGLVRSTREHRAGSPRTLAQLGAVAGVRPLDLAPGGVYLAAVVTCDAGGLLHHRFTIAVQPKPEAVCFLWHYPAGHPGSVLPTTLPCGARTFLTGPRGPARPPGRLTRNVRIQRRARFRSQLMCVGAESSAPLRSMPLTQVVRGDRESRAQARARCPRAGRGLIDSYFAFHVDSAAYELRNPHDHGPGHGLAGTNRTKRARPGPARRRERPGPARAPGPGAKEGAPKPTTIAHAVPAPWR